MFETNYSVQLCLKSEYDDKHFAIHCRSLQKVSVCVPTVNKNTTFDSINTKGISSGTVTNELKEQTNCWYN